ncbi:DeoR/GlpR family DNA-binding transcription regulator [Methylopila turkensis]|uniref:DeoR family transcriptional regulator n=1 Tax=Methylopila turkensis TaxID=1437816 RepID=A0A9W6JNA1_9HYPH|nr:DeoR/GlpR family DNA-binding transcription regulator [Methylopila turkensis]GLK79368.1 DeoR family transcriptional regulator [Methylopila turkensis]
MDRLTPRQQEIVALARSTGRVVVEDLAARFDVTPQTIRKDLNELCDRRLLARTHGGATVAGGLDDVDYEARRFLAQDAKRAIGRATARLTPQGASLFLNVGTTTEEVARALADHDGLTVVTNSLNVASLLHRHPGIDVVVAGGSVRRADAGIVGEPAVDLVSRFKVDVAVLGVSAIDPEGALLDHDYREALVSQAMIANAREVFLVADRLKLQRTAPVRIGHLSQIDVFVTDRVDDPAFAALCGAHDVRVVETDARIAPPAQASAGSAARASAADA